MALPHNDWHEIADGPGTWSLVRAIFRDPEWDAEEGGSSPCIFSVLGSHDQPNHRLTISVEKVARSGNRGSTDYFFYEIEGIILKIDADEWPHPGANKFKASYDPNRRLGSIKILDHVGYAQA